MISGINDVIKFHFTRGCHKTYFFEVLDSGRIFYGTFVGVNEYIPQSKWQAEIGNISENEWKLYFLNIKQWHEVKIRDFQYKINNKILVTYSFLAKINKIDSDLCTYCKE